MRQRASMAVSADADPRWRAIVARDRAADGTFVYSVKSTGVYCLPSCPARLPRPDNVAFHATPAEAERAGFRACKRCKPCDLTPRPKQIQRRAPPSAVAAVSTRSPHP